MRSNNKKLAAKILLILAFGLYHSMPVAYALPSQGTLDNSKAATITTSENMMTIAGKGKNNILNWANFQIGKGETVKFNDKNNYLNLVHGVDISRIYGTLSGGNIVYLVNPNGILFAQGTKIDNVGSFVASTRNISSINKEAFLQDPANTVAVLGSDNPVMDNKDYYPQDSSYVPKISVAEMQLTNVPASATSIILDGPGGVILKNTELLDQAERVTTRKDGGEIGIGSDDGAVVLSDSQKSKITLVDGNKNYMYYDDADLLWGYKTINDKDDFKKFKNSDISSKFMIINDISFAGDDYLAYQYTGGVLDGLGYCVSDMKMVSNRGGFFQIHEGDIRNLNLSNISTYSLDVAPAGGLVGVFKGGCISNVNIHGTLEHVGTIGGIIGVVSNLNRPVEIRNSTNYANIINNCDEQASEYGIGGIIGRCNSDCQDVKLYNVCNYGGIIRENVRRDRQYHNIYLGGIIGNFNSDSYDSNRFTEQNLILLGVCNYGDIKVEGYFEQPMYNVYISGIAGAVYVAEDECSLLTVGEVYNLGKINASNEYIDNNITFHIDNVAQGFDEIKEYKSVVTEETLKVAYLNNNLYGTQSDIFNSFNVGDGLSETEMDSSFNKDMIGVHDFSVEHEVPKSDVAIINPDNGETKIPDDYDGVITVISNSDGIVSEVIFNQSEQIPNSNGGEIIVEESIENIYQDKVSELYNKELFIKKKLDDMLYNMIYATKSDVEINYGEIGGLKNYGDVPQSIVNEFLASVANKIKSTKGYKNYSMNPVELNEQIFEEMKEVFANIEDIYGDDYTIDFSYDLIYQKNGTVIAEVEWVDDSGNHLGKLMWNSYNDINAYQGIVAFADKLNKLNKDAWNDVLREFLNIGLSDVTSKTVANFASELSYAASGGQTIGKFLEGQGKNLGDFVASKANVKIKEFIKKHFVDGEEFISLLEELNDASKKINEYEKLSTKDTDKADKLYNKIRASFNILETEFSE